MLLSFCEVIHEIIHWRRYVVKVNAWASFSASFQDERWVPLPMQRIKQLPSIYPSGSKKPIEAQKKKKVYSLIKRGCLVETNLCKIILQF